MPSGARQDEGRATRALALRPYANVVPSQRRTLTQQLPAHNVAPVAARGYSGGRVYGVHVALNGVEREIAIKLDGVSGVDGTTASNLERQSDGCRWEIAAVLFPNA